MTQREAVTEKIKGNNWSKRDNGDKWWLDYGGTTPTTTAPDTGKVATKSISIQADTSNDDVYANYSGGYKTIEPEETGAEFADRLAKAGVDKLKEYAKVQNFDAQISPSDFGSLYALGDIITCKSSRYGMQFDARVSSFTEREEFGKTTLSVVLGSPDQNAIKGGILLYG